MGDRLRTGKPSQYVTSHPGQLSLAIPPWVGAMSTSESWGVNGHTARYTSPVSVVSQCKLVSGWRPRKRRSAPPYGTCGSEGLYLLRIQQTKFEVAHTHIDIHQDWYGKRCLVTRFVVSFGPIWSVFRVGTFRPIIISLLHTRRGGLHVVGHKMTRRELATIELYSA